MSEFSGTALICLLCGAGLAQGLICKWTWGYGRTTNARGKPKLTQGAIIHSDSIQFKLIMVVYAIIICATISKLIG